MAESTVSEAAIDLASIREALAGDPRARTRVAERLQVVRRLVAAINARSGRPLSSHELDDVAHDVLAIVWQKLQQFEGVGTLERWLYRFCLNTFQNRCRLESRRTAHVSSLSEEPADAADPSTNDIEPSELELALRELGPPCEEVIRLKHEGDLSFEAAAKALGINASTAKTRYYDGVRWLRQRLLRGGGANA
jgi:RNA polymerase sigma factor (sigma-70 family)